MTGDESHVTFDDTSSQAAAAFNRRFAAEGGMSTMSGDDAPQAFPAGPLGILSDSSSCPPRFDEGAADGLDAAVRPPPVVAEDDDDVSFPTGGPAIVMPTDEAAKQAAAWEPIAFVTGSEGQRIVVETTGYAPADPIGVEDESHLGASHAGDENARMA